MVLFDLGFLKAKAHRGRCRSARQHVKPAAEPEFTFQVADGMAGGSSVGEDPLALPHTPPPCSPWPVDGFKRPWLAQVPSFLSPAGCEGLGVAQGKRPNRCSQRQFFDGRALAKERGSSTPPIT